MLKISPSRICQEPAWKAGSLISMVKSMVRGWSDFFNTGGVEEI